ncbi:MAG: SAMP-activating enzyme E1 [Candidatus Woesearchaeota archaeon]|nr:SAMP-activating enzyme E1 [Candidatus Woesearchaeota archaeon]
MRYSRQEIFPKIGKNGQQTLKNKKVTIVGLGALGSNSANLLVRAGIQNLNIVDRDIVQLSNLQRTLFTEQNIGLPKCVCLKNYLLKINSNININSHATDLNHKNIEIIRSDIILDCTDNLETRYLINEYCIQEKIPWIHASCIRDLGEVINFKPGGVCFNCIFPKSKSDQTCETSGILNTTVALTSAVQVNETIKSLLNKKVNPNLIRLNVWKPGIENISLTKNAKCNACNHDFKYITGEKLIKTTKFCGSNTFQLWGEPIKIEKLKKKLQKIGKVQSGDYFLIFKNLTVFKDGRVLVKADNKNQAKADFSKYVGN